MKKHVVYLVGKPGCGKTHYKNEKYHDYNDAGDKIVQYSHDIDSKELNYSTYSGYKRTLICFDKKFVNLEIDEYFDEVIFIMSKI